MITVYKYKIHSNETPTEMHVGAEILHIGIQYDEWYIWAKVDITRETELRYFVMIGTGWEFPDEYSAFNYLNTFMDGPFVWHWFEATPNE